MYTHTTRTHLAEDAKKTFLRLTSSTLVRLKGRLNMKLLKKLTMMLLAVGMTASFTACDGILGLFNQGEESSSGTSQTSEVKEVGQMLTEAEFEAAVQALYSQTNLVLAIEGGEDGGKKTYTGSRSFADGKIYDETITSDENGVITKSYFYCGEVDGVAYMWLSVDNQVWEYYEMEDADTAPMVFLENVFKWCSFDYCTFNNKTEMMEFTGLGAPSVSVKVVNGKIVSYRYEDIDGNWYSATITCGNAVIGELPALD